MMETLRKRISGEEFDYQMLLDALKDYAQPRDKITTLLRRKDIIRVKKGIYIFGDRYARRAYSREVLANMLFGPSYVSLDYALAYHGLIPERVEALTSVTTKRSKRFATPVGLFLYHGIPPEAYPIGVDRVEIDGERAFLVARPEKALADKIQADRGTGIRTQQEMETYLFQQLRLDSALFQAFQEELLERIAERYRSRKLILLRAVLLRRKRGPRA